VAFEIEFEPIDPIHPAWGSVGCVPWDSSCFGFGVGTARLHAPEDVADPGLLGAALDAWMDRHAVRLLDCRFPAEQGASVLAAQRAGFRWVMVSLRTRLRAIRPGKKEVSRISLREVQQDDRAGLERIAQTAFRDGRYFADPAFPNEPASKRFVQWIARAMDSLSSGDPATRIWVIGPVGRPTGFMHVEVDGAGADLRLGAVAEEHVGFGGYFLYAGTLERLQAEGVRTVTAEISATNVPALSLYAALSFEFVGADVVLHRRRGGA